MERAILAVLVTVGLTLTAAPADASTYYGKTARAVAKHIGCKDFNGHRGGGMVHKAGICYLKGRRVNVITFKNEEQQRSWNIVAKNAFGSKFFWGNGSGALVVAKNGNRRAAVLGARRLPGKLVHG